MDEHKVFNTQELKRIKALEIALKYAEYKKEHAGTQEGDLINWAEHIMKFIETKNPA